MRKAKSILVFAMTLLTICSTTIIMPQVNSAGIPPEDTDYVLVDDYWNMKWTGPGTLIWNSSILKYGYGPENGQDAWELGGPPLPPAITSSNGKAYLVATGPDKYIYYSVWSGGVWSEWMRLQGFTDDPPAAAVLDDKLHIVVRGIPNSLWHGHVNLATGSFSGWTRLSGDTISPPTLAASNTNVYLVARGINDHICYRSWSSGSWSDWKSVPGITLDSPAAAVLGNELHLVVRGNPGGLFHGSLNLSTSLWSGWTPVSGGTPSAPSLAASASNLYLVVRGYDDGIHYNVWNGTTWKGWTPLDGVTVHGPSAAVENDRLHVVVRGVPRWTFHGYVNLTAQTFSGWTRLVGQTLGHPSWGNFIDRLWVQFVNPIYGVWDLGEAFHEIVVFPQLDHAPYPAEALEYKIWGSNNFNVTNPGAATWAEADLDRVYRKGWSNIGEGTYATCNDDYVALWDFNCSSYRYIKLQSVWEKPYDEPEIDAVKGVSACNYTGRTVGFWKTNIAKALGIIEGKQQVSTEAILGCLEEITAEYGSSYSWLNFTQPSNEAKLSKAHLILSFYNLASNMTYKARGQTLALLLTVCHLDCASTPIKIPWYNEGETHSVYQWITIIFNEYNSGNFETAKDLADFLNNWGE